MVELQYLIDLTMIISLAHFYEWRDHRKVTPRITYCPQPYPGLQDSIIAQRWKRDVRKDCATTVMNSCASRHLYNTLLVGVVGNKRR